MHFLNISSNVLLVIIGVGLLIFIHELGHFLVAKKCGIRVYAFSMGFGPAIFKKTVGETEYRLSIIPLGGYVKLAGEMPSEENTGDEWEFMSKPPGQRAAVLVAGVSLNAVLAFIAFIIAFNIGVPFISSEIGEVTPGWPAWEAGLQNGDKIVEVNSNTDPDFEDIFTEIALSGGTSGVNLKVERDGTFKDLTVFPRYDTTVGIQRIGIRPAASLEIEKIATFAEGPSPAVEAGLQIGDKIVSVNGEIVKTGNDFINIIAMHPGKEVALNVNREEQEINLKITPRSSSRWMLGLSSGSTHIESVKMGSVAHTVGILNGDKIVSIDSKEVSGWSQLKDRIVNAETGMHKIEVDRMGKIVELGFDITGDDVKNDFLTGVFPYSSLVVDTTIKGFPAEGLGIKSGDKLISVNGNTLTSWEQLLQVVVASQGNEMSLSWNHEGDIVTKNVSPLEDKENALGKIGVKLKDSIVLKQYGFFGACSMGISKTIVNVQRIYFTIKGFITGNVSNKALGGPILIAQASYESAKLGIGKLLYFLGIISINLAFLNILPVPVLDGGHLLFLLVEKIKGSPVSQRTLAIANYIGMGMVLSLVIFATKNDVMRILKIL